MGKITKRRVIQYIIGLCLMAMGVVLTKRSDLGLSPFSTAPAALSNITSISLGITTIIIHIFCIVVITVIEKKLTLRSIITFCIAWPFGLLVDFMMMFVGPMTEWDFSARLLINCVGLVINAAGVTLIVGADLCLPAPDAMLRFLARHFDKSYPLIKNIGDISWMIFAAALEFIFLRTIKSVGIGTVLSAIFVGRLIKLFNKVFPWVRITDRAREQKM